MFFQTKGSVRKQVTDGMRPFLRMVDITGGLPVGFWDDPQILGYLTGCMRGLITIISRKKYAHGGAGEIMIGVLDDLAGKGRGLELAKKVPQLMQLPDFDEAVNNRMLSVMVAYHGPEKVRDEPIVKKATEHAIRLHSNGITDDASSPAAISAAIANLCFGKRVQELQDQTVDA